MGVISKGCIRGGKKRPGRACQHCDKQGTSTMILKDRTVHDAQRHQL